MPRATYNPGDRVPRTIAEIRWGAWQAVDQATLMFIVAGDRVLLIRKKRGLGAGKVNGPGGRLEPGETPLAGAIRETEEEVCVTPEAPVESGELLFQFVDGYSLHVFVFRATAFAGEPAETAEAEPFWADVNAIPYDDMWVDDRIWLPVLLAGRRFRGTFVFDGDAMLDHSFVELGSASHPH